MQVKKRKQLVVTGLIVLGVLVLIHAVGAWLAASMILHPLRLGLEARAETADYATPADLRRAYADLEVQSGDVTIRGWLVRKSGDSMRGAPSVPDRTTGMLSPDFSPSARAVILIHGLGDNRVGMLPYAAALDGLDANLVLIDLRAHGESGGDALTYGVRERGDVKAVIDWLIERDLARPGRIALVGISLGGSVALQTAADDRRVAAVVTDGAFARLRPTINRYARQRYVVTQTIAPLGILLAERRARFTVWDASPLTSAGRIACPVLLIHGGDDPVIPPSHARDLEAALAGPKELWVIPGAGHCQGLENDPVLYGQRLREFLTRHLGVQ